MKKLVLLAVLMAAGIASAQTYVQPHIRKDGTVVQGHYRSTPDSTPVNNYGTQGNTNPYTGQHGTVNPYAQPQQPSYQQPTYGGNRGCSGIGTRPANC
ncbi:MAG: hypothetical protein M3Q12_01115 [Pseudomonadota bacterium]|nr:hypothetical protein [Pseudomonadota bacterium]